MSYEYEDVESWEQFQQGEVIEWVGDSVKPPWYRYGIIITADCDLHRDKHGGYISYLPAMTTEDFIWTFWRYDIFEPELGKRVVTLAQRINNWRKKNLSSTSDMSPAVIAAWLERTGPDGLLNELGCNDKGQRNQLLNVIQPVYDIALLLKAAKPDLTSLESAYKYVSAASATDSSIITKAFQAVVGSLPGDIFYIPGLPDNETDGLFVLLRHIRQCRDDDIAKKPDDIRFEGAQARRIARVTATFRYAISQNFAKVFSDIGLPEDHEQRRKGASERFFSSRS